MAYYPAPVTQPLRVYLSELAAGERALDDAATRYLLRVHRLSRGDRFTAFDPEARLEADGELVETQRKSARARLGEPRPATRTSELEVRLLQSFGKGDKVDRVVRDATALGVRAVVVVETERSVVRIDEPERAEGRRRRWRTIAVESARQSGRGDLPELFGPLPLAEALAPETAVRRICLDARAERTLARELEAWRSSEPIAVLIGPEGGLAPSEIALAEEHGFVRVKLGSLVLRTETAATAVLGALCALRG